jgi:excisionase family DNA binding protein
VEQLELEVLPVALPAESLRRSKSKDATARLGQRLALSPDEAAAVLGVSRDYLDERVIGELRVVRRGRRVLIALRELERWLDQSATPGTLGRGA